MVTENESLQFAIGVVTGEDSVATRIDRITTQLDDSVDVVTAVGIIDRNRDSVHNGIQRKPDGFIGPIFHTERRFKDGRLVDGFTAPTLKSKESGKSLRYWRQEKSAATVARRHDMWRRAQATLRYEIVELQCQQKTANRSVKRVLRSRIHTLTAMLENSKTY